MEKRKLLLIILILTFVSGRFTLGRLGADIINIEVRYLLLLGFLIIILIPSQSKTISKSSIYKNNRITLFILATVIYFSVSMFSIVYSPDKFIAFDKFIDILFISLLISSIFYIMASYKKIDFFINVSQILIAVGIIYAIPIFLSALSGAARGAFELGGYNVVTRMMFFSACSSLFLLTIRKKSFYFILAVCFLMAIVMLGSRGGMVGAFSALLALFFVRYVFTFWRISRGIRIQIKKTLRFSIYSLIGIGLVVLAIEPLKRIFENRFIKLMIGREDGIYTGGRDKMYALSFELFKEKPILGHGIDAFEYVTGVQYPHNIMFEMMVDVGIFGLAFFIVTLIFSVYIMFKLKKSKLFILSCLPFYMVLVSMFSGDLYDYRYFFFWLIPLLYYGTLKNKKVTCEQRYEVRKNEKKVRKKYKLVW